MPRPKNRIELLELSNKNFNTLIDYIDSLTEKEREKEFPKGMMNRNIRDVLAHLHQWHLFMKEWYSVGMKGEKPDIPAKDYTWKTTPELNKTIWEKYKNTDLAKVKQLLQKSFNEIQNIIKNHTDKELFEKKKYKWTGTTSLGAYLVSATSSHYDWAMKLIKKARK